MNFNDTVAKLDEIYSRSIDEKETDADRKLVGSLQRQLIGKCDTWLASGVLNAEKRSFFKHLRDLAAASCAELERGYDILLHWPLQRDLLSRLRAV